MKVPEGFFLNGWHAGIKKNYKKDFGFIFCESIANAAAVFTQNKFVGNPVIVGREHIKDGYLQCIVVNSGNSNVATGKEGLELAYNTCKWVGQTLRIKEQNVIPCSTGVIGRMLDADVMRNACFSIKNYMGIEPTNFSEAILTTDQFPKYEYYQKEYTIVGFAKGAGMIQPNMATMLSFIITDISMDSNSLRNLIHFITNKTFNRISVDSDTSTSDTFIIMANGKSSIKVKYNIEDLEALQALSKEEYLLILDYVNNQNHEILPELKNRIKIRTKLNDEEVDFLLQIYRISLQLSKKILKDGEGATKIFRINIWNAPNKKIAEKIGRSIINSPLIKTAIFGGDPNWGRFIMAIGKVMDEEFDISKIKLYCNDKEFYPRPADLELLAKDMSNQEIYFDLDLGNGNVYDSFWGCDLTYDYVKLNSEYTT